MATKDGPIRIPGSLEIDFSATSILSVGDPYVDQLEEALDNDDIIEIWEINKAEKAQEIMLTNTKQPITKDM